MSLLRNRGLEKSQGYADKQDNVNVRVYREDGSPVDTVARGEDNPPAGWGVWYTWDNEVPWDEGNDVGFARPESRYAPHEGRAKDGDTGFVLYGFQRIHRGGLFQPVYDAEPGVRYNWTIATHAWSSNDNVATTSESAPHPFYGTEEEVEELVARDYELRGLLNFRARVGVDPTGNMDPFADTVIWGEWAHVYNAYHDLPSVSVVAQGERLTVFTEHLFRWPFMHNDVYYDSALLTISQDQPAHDAWVDGREPYERTYLLLDPTSDREWASAAVEATWDAKRWTVGGSADDAGIGPRDGRRVIAVNPSGWGDNLEEFFETHYPGLVYSAIHADSPSALAFALRRIIEQDGGKPAPSDVPWDEDLAAIIPRRDDLERWPEGRWPHRELSDITHVTVHHIASEADVFNHARAYLGKGSGRPAPAYTLWIERDGTVKKLLYLDEGNWHDHTGADNAKHLSVGLNGNLTQYSPTPEQLSALIDVCVWAIQNPEMSIGGIEDILGHKDWHAEGYTECPGWDSDESGNWRGVFFAGLQVALGEEPEPEPTPTPPSGGQIQELQNLPPWLMGAHVKGTFKYQDKWQVEAPPSVLKFFVAGDTYDAGKVSWELEQRGYPETRTIWRKYVANDGAYVNVANRRESARQFLELYKLETQTAARNKGISEEELLRHIDYIGSVNEVIGTFDPETPRVVEFDVHLADLVDEWAGGLVKANLLTVAVGNPHESEVELMLPVAKVCHERGHVIDYHGYWTAVPGRSFLEEHWLYHAGRALDGWDPVFRAHGYFPLYVAGESGVVASHSADGTDFGGGLSWKALGDFPNYLEQIKRRNELLMAWNAAHGNRCLGDALFTMEFWGWDHFKIGEGEVLLIIEAAKDLYRRLGIEL